MRHPSLSASKATVLKLLGGRYTVTNHVHFTHIFKILVKLCSRYFRYTHTKIDKNPKTYTAHTPGIHTFFTEKENQKRTEFPKPDKCLKPNGITSQS